jgi:hypothetical protein
MLSPSEIPAESDTECEQRQDDLENGKHGVKGCDGGPQEQRHPGASGVVGVLDSVKAVIDFAARYMARMTSDPVVDGAERGFLLPVREEERELAVGMV